LESGGESRWRPALLSVSGDCNSRLMRGAKGKMRNKRRSTGYCKQIFILIRQT
jgi:hypothetical protein